MHRLLLRLSSAGEYATRWPATLVCGVGLIVACEVLLTIDVRARDGAIMPGSIPTPSGMVETVARAAAVFLTPLCWTGFLLLADGVLQLLGGGAPARVRPRRFALAYAASIPIWLFFDGINFGFLGAWTYHGLPENVTLRWLAYALSFGAISPAMFLSAEAALRTPLSRLSGPHLQIPRYGGAVLEALGAALLLLAIALGGAIGVVPLWLGVVLLLDPLNRRLGAPSLLADWESGRWGRTVALMAGGMVCGLLWEFWNYWAVAKWTYHLSFLGVLEHARYFEMPIIGLGGFLPFALECWAAFQTVAWLASGLGLRTEKLPNGRVL
jgi:hypothetical protein